MLLSIIIPCYNSARFINKTLDMLIEQGLENCEVIVINDGSTDETSKIVHQYSDKYENIKIIDKKNEGVSVARNTGLKESCGKYIVFLDSDDSFTEGTLDYYREILKKYHQNTFLSFGYYTIYKGKKKKDYAFRVYDGKEIESTILKHSYFSKKLCFHICSSIYEKDFLIKNNIYFTPGVRIGEDIEFILSVVKYTATCVYHARHCFIYQIRDDSTMQGYKTYSVEQFNSFVIIYEALLSITNDKLKLSKNYFLVFSYISNLYHYKKSKNKSEEISQLFKSYKNVLSFPISFSFLKLVQLFIKLFFNFFI